METWYPCSFCTKIRTSVRHWRKIKVLNLQATYNIMVQVASLDLVKLNPKLFMERRETFASPFNPCFDFYGGNADC